MKTTTSCSKRELAVDVESFSSVDIDAGVYAYVNAPDFELILVAYKFDDEEKPRSFMPRRFAARPGVLSAAGVDGEQVALMEPELPELDGDEDEFLAALTDPEIVKTAYNANFERTTLAKHYGVECDPDQWRCTAVLASTLGLPRSLAGAGEAMGLPNTRKEAMPYEVHPARLSAASDRQDHDDADGRSFPRDGLGLGQDRRLPDSGRAPDL